MEITQKIMDRLQIRDHLSKEPHLVLRFMARLALRFALPRPGIRRIYHKCRTRNVRGYHHKDVSVSNRLYRANCPTLMVAVVLPEFRLYEV